MNKKTDWKTLLFYFLLVIFVLIPYVGMWFYKSYSEQKIEEMKQATVMVISKEEMNLRLFDYRGEELLKYLIACGKNYGNKQVKGDLKTPEGVFHVVDIQDAATWTHDFGDGKGEIEGAYGPFFIRLQVPGHKGIGIHGTHKPESIGTRDTEGCIRLRNEDLEQLRKYIYVGMLVVILSEIPREHCSIQKK